MKLFELYATLGLDTSGFSSGVEQAGSEMQSLGDTLSAKTVAIGTAVGNLVTSAVKTAAKGAVQIAKQAVEASAEVSAENAQFAATFGDMADAAEEAYGKIGKETNILTTRLRATGTKGFAQLTGAGVSASEALDTSAQMLQLSADAAAYYDITLEAADERIRSFMRGNTEAGDAIGLFTSETQRNTRAMELYKKKWSELTEAQRQNLMLNVAQEIYEQSGVIGQAAREGHEWLNVTENLSESWRQTLANLGEPLKNALIPGIEKVTELLNSSEVQEKIGQIGAAVGEFATEALSALIDGLDWCIDNQSQVESTISAIATGLAGIAAISFPKISLLVAALNGLGVINLTGQTYNEEGQLVLSDGSTKHTLREYAQDFVEYVNDEKDANGASTAEDDTVLGLLFKQTLPNAVSGAKIAANEFIAFLGGTYNEELYATEKGKIQERLKELTKAINRGDWLWKDANDIGVNRAIAVDMQEKDSKSVALTHEQTNALISDPEGFWASYKATGTFPNYGESEQTSTTKSKIKDTIQATAVEYDRAEALEKIDLALIQSMIAEKENGVALAANYSATINQANAEALRAEKMSDTSGAAAELAQKMEDAIKAADEAGTKTEETKEIADEAGDSIEGALNPDGEGISALAAAAEGALVSLQAQAEATAEAIAAAFNTGSYSGSTTPQVVTGGGSGGTPLVTAFGDTYNPLASLTRHATGLPTVPFDGYLAMLHRGEAILTRREADAYRSGREEKTKDVTIVQNIQSVPLRPSELAAQTRHAFNSLRFSV